MNEAIEVEIDDSIHLDCYLHIPGSVADIDFLWGGRDSGKSFEIAQNLVVQCLESERFKCLLIRKTFASIKDSQWQLLKDVVEEWGLSDLFTFNKSPLEIHCVNGNSFIARGCDDPAKVKSLTNPTCAWFEESNQLTQNDYIVVSTTLRSNDGRVKQYHSFNPETDGDYKKHWLWPYFAEQYKAGVMSFNGERIISLPDGSTQTITYTSTHTTYHQNPYCTAERIATLEQLSIIDPYYYQVFVKGLWGNKENKRPFVVAYDPAKHNASPEWNQAEITYLSFDFNKNPMCCSVLQHYDGILRVLRTIKIPNSDIFEMCEFIKAYYPDAVFIVTGDASGNNMSAMAPDSLNYYKIIMNELNLSSSQFEIPNANPPLKKNRMVVNAVLATYKVEVHEVDAQSLIFDFQFAECHADGTLIKNDRDDEAQQLDPLDTFRYFCNTFMLPYVNLEF